MAVTHTENLAVCLREGCGKRAIRPGGWCRYCRRRAIEKRQRKVER